MSALTKTHDEYKIRQEKQYSPLTKSLNIDETLMLIQLTSEFTEIEAWRDEALFRLPQPSRQRRLEVVQMAQRLFLPTSNGNFVNTPLRRLLMAAKLDARLKRDLLFVQYLWSTPLVWQTICAVLLPRVEAAVQSTSRQAVREVTATQLDNFLADKLSTHTPSTMEKTRNHITAHLVKFGLLDAEHVPGDRIAKRFFAHFYEPDPRAFWFSLVLELAQQGSFTRGLDALILRSWTRTAYCTRPAYARYALEEAERQDLVVPSFFGSEKQLTWRGPDPVNNVVEAILYG